MKTRAPSPEASAILARHWTTSLRALMRPLSRSSAKVASVGVFGMALSPHRFFGGYELFVPEIGAPRRFFVGHLRNGAGKAHPPVFQHKYARRHFEETDVLLGD